MKGAATLDFRRPGRPEGTGTTRWRASAARAAVLFAALTALLVSIGYRGAFCSFATYDDEGYLLITLDAVRHGGALYNDVYTSYGPFFYRLMDGLFALSGQPVSHNAGRLVTLGLWVGSSLLSGVFTWRTCRSLILGLGAQIVVFRVLGALVEEPMHPGALIALCLAGMAVCSLWLGKWPRLALGLLGLGSAALTLTKLNVGVFAIGALAFTCVGQGSPLMRRRWPFYCVAAAIVVLPFALMAPCLRERWAVIYALFVAISGFAVIWATERIGPPATVTRSELLVGVGAFVLATGLTIAATLRHGTSLAGLVDGLIVRPSRHFTAVGGSTIWGLPSVFVPSAVLVLASLALLAAVAGPSTRRLKPTTEGAIRLAVGLGFWISVSGGFVSSYLRGPRFAFLFAAFAWVAAIRPRDDEGADEHASVRRFLPLFAVLQTLQAFPVPGTQIRTGTFLLIPLGAMCIADGMRMLSRARAAVVAPKGSHRAAAVFALILVAPVAGLLAYRQRTRNEYASNVVLSFPGAERLHLPGPRAAMYQAVVAAVGERCSTFVMLPGMNSFYLWAHQTPPTWLNTTTWPFLFEPALQARIVDRLNRSTRVCGLYSPTLAQGWAHGLSVPHGPLVDYFAKELVPKEQIGDYVLLEHHAAGPPSP